MSVVTRKTQILPMNNELIVKNRQSKCNLVTIREFLRLTAQVLVPLMIGTFTIVMALQQHQFGKENRQNDIEIARQHRQQAFEINEQHRKQEILLDETRRSQDLSIADKYQRDSVFNSYIRELTGILLRNKFELNRPLLDSVIRPMTLTILRQLDSSRKVLLLKFLYESKMLQTNFEETRVDLTDADLDHIEINEIHLHNLSLVGSSLKNATFIRTDLTNADFERVDLSNSRFFNVNLNQVSFYRTNLQHVDFSQSKFSRTDLTKSNLNQSTINRSQFAGVSLFNHAILSNGEEAFSENLIEKKDRCSADNWFQSKLNQIEITKQCHWKSSSEDLILKYNQSLFPFQRLIQQQKALLRFHFQTLKVYSHCLNINFTFFSDQNGVNRIDQSNSRLKIKSNLIEKIFFRIGRHCL